MDMALSAEGIKQSLRYSPFLKSINGRTYMIKVYRDQTIRTQESSMATVTATSRPRPGAPQRGAPPRTTPELVATIKIESINTFIDEIPMKRPNPMDQVSAGMKEHKSKKIKPDGFSALRFAQALSPIPDGRVTK